MGLRRLTDIGRGDAEEMPLPESAITVAGVTKTFRIYRQRETTLKETLLNRRRGVYEEFTAVDDVSFEVPTGQALGIFGRNGSGKSTMLKMLARILEPDAGSVEVKGRVAALLEVGAGFHPEYSAIENIFLSGAIYGMSRQDLMPRVDEIIAFAQLERFADNPVKTYSSGMYARLGFSIAVNVDPDVLLVDEVLAVGDESFRSRCYERMLEFREHGKTLDPRDARPRSDRLVLRPTRSGSTRAAFEARAPPRRSPAATSPR